MLICPRHMTPVQQRGSTRLQIGLQRVFVALELPTTRWRTLGWLAIKDLFGNLVMMHHITDPAKLSCYQVGFNTIDLTTLKDRRVWDQVLPFDICNLAEAAKMELIKLCNVPTVRCPRLTAIQ